MTYTPNLVPCKLCKRMPDVKSEFDFNTKRDITMVWCPRCFMLCEAKFFGANEWNAAQQARQHWGEVTLARPAVGTCRITYDYPANALRVYDDNGEIAVAQPFLVPDHR